MLKGDGGVGVRIGLIILWEALSGLQYYLRIPGKRSRILLF